jgi:shikimate kinase
VPDYHKIAFKKKLISAYMQNKKWTPIFLFGFMGAGKSTVGKKIATKLKAQFFDLDNVIVEKEKISISSIFEKYGELYFRGLEFETLKELIKQEKGKKVVISLGGGTPCIEENLAFLLQYGICIYLKVPNGILANRLEGTGNTRPLLKNKSLEEIQNYIEDTLEVRESFYNKAHLTIEGGHLNAEKTNDFVKKIEHLL